MVSTGKCHGGLGCGWRVCGDDPKEGAVIADELHGDSSFFDSVFNCRIEPMSGLSAVPLSIYRLPTRTQSISIDNIQPRCVV